MGQKWGVPAKSGNVLENVGSGAMAYGSGRAQELRASFAKDSVPDEFDRINQWMDTGDNKSIWPTRCAGWTTPTARTRTPT